MKYKCLVFDHDDTVVNSTATIHQPCFSQYLKEFRPHQSCSLEHYIAGCFRPGFLQMLIEEYGFGPEELKFEEKYWHEYAMQHIPPAYPGIREIMERQKAEGGLICVISHSYEDNIARDYANNSLPAPDLVFGWSRPPEERKPNAFPLLQILKTYELQPHEVLMIDDLKLGYDMALACGVDFAAVGWAYENAEIEAFMRGNCPNYFKTVSELDAFLRSEGE